MTKPSAPSKRHRALGPAPTTDLATRKQAAERRQGVRAALLGLTGLAGMIGGMVLLKHNFTIAGVLAMGVGAMFTWGGEANAVQREVDEAKAAEDARLAAAQAEADAIARAERREQAALAALKASIEAKPAYHQETDEPIKPSAGAPFRDNFQTVAERVMRPTLAEPSPTNGASTAAASNDGNAPKLLK